MTTRAQGAPMNQTDEVWYERIARGSTAEARSRLTVAFFRSKHASARSARQRAFWLRMLRNYRRAAGNPRVHNRLCTAMDRLNRVHATYTAEMRKLLAQTLSKHLGIAIEIVTTPPTLPTDPPA